MPSAQAYAELHRKFLKEHRPKMYAALKKDGTLEQHVRTIGQQALERYETIEGQMLTSKSLPQDYLARVKKLEEIPHVAEEIVLHEIVLPPNA